MALIQDIIPPPKRIRLDTPEVAAQEEAQADNRAVIRELWSKGVTIEEVFEVFYELEALSDAELEKIFGNDEDGQHGAPVIRKPLTVADAQLAGVAKQVNIEEKPF